MLTLLLLLAAAVANLSVGASSLTLDSWVHPGSAAGTILYQLRLPHLLVVSVAGALLAVTGAAAQALFRNPLADPSLIGVSAGAALTSVALMVGAGTWIATVHLGWLLLPVAAFIGGVLATLLVMRLAHTAAGLSVTLLLLCGMAVNAIAVALIGALKYFSDDVTLRQISFWLLGDLSTSHWEAVIALLLAALPVCGFLLHDRYRLNILLLGAAQAQSLGVDVARLQKRLVLLCALGVGTVVAFGGLIGFVGLIVPHIVRLAAGPDNRHLLPISIVLGALFMVSADLLSRTLVAPAMLPIGIVTALVGGPFFLLLLIRFARLGGRYE